MSYVEIFIEAWPSRKSESINTTTGCRMSFHILKTALLQSHLKPSQIIKSMGLLVPMQASVFSISGDSISCSRRLISVASRE